MNVSQIPIKNIAILCFLFMVGINVSHAQEAESFSFKGVVMDQDLEFVAGAQVVNFNNKKATITDSKGSFTLRCKPLDTLIIASMGHEAVKIVVYISDFSERGTKERIITLKPTPTELDRVEIYDFKSWDAFKKEFAEVDVQHDEVNTKGLPAGEPSKIPQKYRSNEFAEKPSAGRMALSPFSSAAYLLSAKEKEKRKALAQWKSDQKTALYYSLMVPDSVQKMVPVQEEDMDDFILYCNENIEDKTLDNEYLYKEKIRALYTIFTEERKGR